MKCPFCKKPVDWCDENKTIHPNPEDCCHYVICRYCHINFDFDQIASSSNDFKVIKQRIKEFWEAHES